MTDTQEFEARLRAWADREPVPEPSREDCDAILERRARGDRITLSPIGRLGVGRTRRLLGPALAAAGLALVGLWLRDRVGPGTPAGALPNGSLSLAPGTLAAQTTSYPQFPILHAPTRPLQPGGWIYTGELPDQIRPRDVVFVYRLVQSHYEGQAAWLLLAGSQGPDRAPVFSDSTWVSRDQLAVLAQHRDTTVRAQPVPANFLAVLQAAELSDDWSASVPLLGAPRPRWMNLRVYGRETITVPAGRFVCWKVGFAPNIGFYFWISRYRGWPVRQGMEQPENLAYGKMNLMLLRREQP